MNWFWDNICLKKADRAGMFAFLSILFLLLLIKWYLVVFYEPNFEKYPTDAFDEVDYVKVEPVEYEKETRPKIVYSKLKSKHKRENKSVTATHKTKKKRGLQEPNKLFFFDPNTISQDSLLLMGVSKYAASNIVKYRSKGGRFKESNDLKRIYGMDEEVLKNIQPFVNIIDNSSKANPKETIKPEWMSKKPSLALHSIDINLADTSTFKSLKGIGSVYANRIVKYRNSLGGYFTVNQIKEVWGISDSLFFAIEPYLTLDTSILQKQNINQLEKDKLVKHPYIDWKKAKAIISYRKMHGDYQSIDDFKKLHGIEVDFVDTLRYYFVAQ